jgi:hypothetical protein
VQTPPFGDDLPQRQPVRFQLFFEHRRWIDEAVPRHVDVHRHRLRPFDGRDPLGRVRGAHGRKDPVEKRLAHEEDAFLRQVHAQVASRMSASEEQQLDFLVAQAKHGLVRHRRHASGRRAEDGFRRRVNEERRGRRKGGIARGVIAVV